MELNQALNLGRVSSVKKSNTIIQSVNRYYREKLLEYGPTPQGVDWKDQKSQYLRFMAISKLFSEEEMSFSIADLGCGYGAFYDYLVEVNPGNVDYYGYDIAKEMIEQAAKLHSAATCFDAEFITLQEDMTNLKEVDYFVASGIFNVKLNFEPQEWLDYILAMLKVMNTYSRKGFAFNLLTSYSDLDRQQDRLFYADPCFLFDYCKRNYAKNIALLHDYDLYEFTILVRK